MSLVLAAMLAVSSPAAATDPAHARRLFDELVAFRTVAGQAQVPTMAARLAGEFHAAGFDPADVEVEPLDDTASLTVRYPGRAGSTLAPVVFLAHMDVVDADPAEWKTDPWTVTEVDGTLHGRGVADNKYGLLALVHAFTRLKREGHVPSRDLFLVLTGDEETTMATTRRAAERFRGAAFVVNADTGGGYRPTEGTPRYYLQVAEKTYASFELAAPGEAGHSATPHPDNAIHRLAAALTRVAALRFPVRWNAATVAGIGSHAEHPDPAIAAAAARFAASPGDPEAVAVLEREYWIDRELRTTCVPTMLDAGTAENVLPTRATATVNCRAFPGETVSSVRDALVQAIDDAAVTVTTVDDPVESPELPVPADVNQALQRVLAARLPGATVVPYMEAGATDGLHFRRAGIPTVGAGAIVVEGEHDLAYHAPDEGLQVASFDQGLDHFYRFVKALD